MPPRFRRFATRPDEAHPWHARGCQPKVELNFAGSHAGHAQSHLASHRDKGGEHDAHTHTPPHKTTPAFYTPMRANVLVRLIHPPAHDACNDAQTSMHLYLWSTVGAHQAKRATPPTRPHTSGHSDRPQVKVAMQLANKANAAPHQVNPQFTNTITTLFCSTNIHNNLSRHTAFGAPLQMVHNTFRLVLISVARECPTCGLGALCLATWAFGTKSNKGP